MKNTHLEHLEDNILNDGSQGGKEAVAFLRSLGEMLDQGAADARVSRTARMLHLVRVPYRRPCARVRRACAIRYYLP